MVSWFRRKPQGAPPIVHGTIELAEPSARSSSRNAGEAAGFVTIANTGPDADRLVAASSPLAETVEIHGIKVVGPNIQMRPFSDGLALPAGVSKTLKPRGYHLLLRGLTAPLAKGSTLPVTLTFEKAGALVVDFAVEEPGLIGVDVLNEQYHRG